MGKPSVIAGLRIAALGLGGCTAWPGAALADNFQRVSYDPSADELVIVVLYRGTNPDHQFNLHWGPCQTHDDRSQEIVGELLDQQFQDAARKDYRKTLHFSVSHLACRPAKVTLRTAPRFYYTLTIPAAPADVTSP